MFQIFFKTAFWMCLCVAGLIAVILATYQFQMFLGFRLGRPRQLSSSYKNNSHRPTAPYVDGKGSHGEVMDALSSSIVDVLLLGVFTLQHSVMARPNIRQFISDWGFGVAERSLYCLATSASVLLLSSNWRAIPWYIWQFNSEWVHYLSNLMNCIVWIILYGGCLQMDLPLLVGVKQVYYYVRGWPDPMSKKTPSTLRLYRHMRHPSLICFCALFWLNPYMRLLLAVIFTVYMKLAWNVDRLDCEYQKEQLTKKEHEFSIRKLFS